LTSTPEDDRSAHFSADGTMIAWSHGRDVWTMNADGSGKTEVVNDTGSAGSPSWSPDGTQLLYNSDADGDYDVYLANSDGTGTPVNLTNNTYFDCCAQFSPSGTQIVYQTAPFGGADYDIYTMDPDGGNKTARAANHGGGAYEVGPSWSPDGAHILYSRDFGFGSGWAEIFRMDADGTDQTNVTNSCCAWEFGVYSPDGSMIAFSSNAEDSLWELYVKASDWSGAATRLNTNVGRHDMVTDWGVVPVIPASIDIRPGSSAPNQVNPASHAAIPVAVLSDSKLDATDVEQSTVAFGPAGAAAINTPGQLKDVDRDGDLDLVLQFRASATGIACGDTSATLTGKRNDGRSFEGSDAVTTLGCG
jgi:Tol biopolymer transport system component